MGRHAGKASRNHCPLSTRPGHGRFPGAARSPPMIRRLFTILSAVSASVWLVSCLLWSQSYGAALWYPLYLEGSGRQMHVWSGRLFLFDHHVMPEPPPGTAMIRFDTPSIGKQSVPRTGPSFAALVEELRRTQQGGASRRITSHRVALPPATWRDGFGFAHVSLNGGPGRTPSYRSHLYSVPLWAICVVTAVLPINWIARRGRNRRRRHLSLCATCGYDLRATPGRCPECGATSDER